MASARIRISKAALAGALIATSLIALLVVVRHAAAVPGVNDPVPRQVQLMAIDLDTTGNPVPGTPGLLGPIDECRVVTVGETVTFDIVVDELSPLDHIIGSVARFTYNGSVMTLTSETLPPLGSLLVASDPTPDSDGSLQVYWLTLGLGIQDPGEHVVSRLTLAVTGAGTSALDLFYGDIFDGIQLIIPDVLGDAVISTDPSQCNDDDGDGTINGLDNCPSATNPDQLDTDNDGEGDACDDDNDGDGVLDGADNCPLDSNPGQENNAHPGTPSGDHCEDPDADGVMDFEDNCPDAANAGQENAVHPGTNAGDHCEDPDADGVMDLDDNCPDTNTVWRVPVGDTDCDGWTDANEPLIGTNASVACGYTSGGAPESETWPPDLVESNGVDISDVLALKPVFGTAVPPTSGRYDLVPGGGVNISDVLALKPVFGEGCTP